MSWTYESDTLMHYGIPGMRKGVRREELLERRREMMARQQAAVSQGADPRQARMDAAREAHAQRLAERKARYEQIRNGDYSDAGPDEDELNEAISRAQAAGQKKAASQMAAARAKGQVAEAQQQKRKFRAGERGGRITKH